MFRTRIAPTPSGFLHAGNGISFILTCALARAFGGFVLLRIDDLDNQRMRLEYVEDIFRTLDWLGLNYDEGPTSTDDFYRHFSQHLRLDFYHDAIKKLQSDGCVYECRCSRNDIRLHSNDGLYPKTCRKYTITPNEAHKKDTAWRIIVEEPTRVSFNEWQKEKTTINLYEAMGDFVVLQKNGLPAYQVASLCDDTLFNINFIVRGNDLLYSTAAQIYLAEKIKNAHFFDTTFFHHSLLKNTEGVKFSKSKGASALNQWRASHISPATLFQKAAEWLNISNENIEFIQDMDSLIISIKNSLTSPI